MISIKDFSQKTGINAVTLRAWERRYGLIQPQRTEKGHRLYSTENLLEVEEILDWLARGVPISKVKPLLSESVNDKQIGDIDSASLAVANEWVHTVNRMVELIRNVDLKEIEQTTNEMLALHPIHTLIEFFFVPLFHKFTLEKSYTYHLAAAIFRQLLEAKLNQRVIANANTDRPMEYLVVSLSGEHDYTHCLLIANYLNSVGLHASVIGKSNGGIDLKQLNDSGMTSDVLFYGEYRSSLPQYEQLIQQMEEQDLSSINIQFAGPLGRLIEKESKGHWIGTNLLETINKLSRPVTHDEKVAG